MKLVQFSILMSLVSCAAMEKQWIKQNCSEGAAYSKGVEDAQNERSHNTYMFDKCPNKAEIGTYKKEYSKGYIKVTNSASSVIKKIIDVVN